MALVLKNRVLETCTSPGTGTVTLLGATTGYQTFSATVGNGNTCYYTIADQGSANWEVGIGTYATTGNTLTRNTVLSSSNGGSLTNFSTGTQNVFVDYPAEKAVYLDANGAYIPASPVFNGNAIIADNSANAALRITQTGTGNALLVEDSANPDATPFVVSAAGLVGIGTTAPSSALDIGSSLSAGTFASQIFSANNSAAAKTNYVKIDAAVALNSATAEAGSYTLQVLQNNAYKTIMTAAGALYNSTNYLAFGTTNEAIRIVSNGTTSIGGIPGAESLRVTPVASAVNYLNVSGAVTTAAPILSAQGSDTNIGITLTPKGTGVVTVSSDALVNGITIGKGGGAQHQNNALGSNTLNRNTTGNQNTGAGLNSLFFNVTGSSNTAFGISTLVNNTTGSNQTAVGNGALAVATTAVATLGAITAGSGYTNGTYTAVAMTPISGATFVTYPTVTVVVAGGVVTTVTLVTAGVGASSTAATVLTVAAALIGGTGSGFSIPVATFATAAQNTAIGASSLSANTTGSSNTATGQSSLQANTTGSFNSAFGYNALGLNATGVNNSAFGYTALATNTTGGSNTAFGFQALAVATTAHSNTVVGSQAAGRTTTGGSNVAVGYLSLFANTIGSSSTAVGTQALFVATSNVATLGTITGGSGYTDGTYTGVVMTLSSGSTAATYPTATIVVAAGAVTTVTITSAGASFKDTTTVLTAPAASIGGTGSGFSVPVATLSTATNNTAIGLSSMVALTTGSYNTGLGQQTLSNATTAQQNTALGFQAGSTITTGINNLILGYNAAASTTTVSNEITLGDSSITAFRIPGLSISAGVGTLTVGSSFAVTNVASAVNYVQVSGNVTGGGVTVSAQGSDTNVSIAHVAKGTGFHSFYSSAGNPQFFVLQTASGVNYLTVQNAATGNSPTMRASGSDTNVDLALTPQGTGVLKFGTYTAGILAQAGYITIKDAAGNTRNLLVG